MKIGNWRVKVRQVVGTVCLVPLMALTLSGFASRGITPSPKAPDYVVIAFIIWFAVSAAAFFCMLVNVRSERFSVIGLAAWAVFTHYIWLADGKLPNGATSASDLFLLSAFWLWPIVEALDLVVGFRRALEANYET